jgi:hypothetical protein
VTRWLAIAIVLAGVRAVAAPSDACVAAAGEPAIAFGRGSLVAICHDVYVDPATTPAERADLARASATAVHRVADALGELHADRPVTIFCKTDACQLYFAGTYRRSYVLEPGEVLPGATYSPDRLTVVIVRVDAPATNVLVHELVHVELDARLHHAFVPAWFHEGIAASLADAPTCPPNVTRGIDDLRRLDRRRAWADYTNQPGTIERTYCQARAEVEAWTRRFGTSRVFQMLDAVRDGAAFYELYGAMLTQPSRSISTVVMSRAAAIDDRAFSIAMWIRPTARGGTLARVSSTEVGTGWCTPFLGYNGNGQLIAQVLVGNGADAADFVLATDPKRRPLGTWSHVAMTWSPTAGERLYVDGVLAAATAAPHRRPVDADPVYVAWGSQNVGGASCFQGAITAGTFDGAITGMRFEAGELDARAIARLASANPAR